MDSNITMQVVSNGSGHKIDMNGTSVSLEDFMSVMVVLDAIKDQGRLDALDVLGKIANQPNGEISAPLTDLTGKPITKPLAHELSGVFDSPALQHLMSEFEMLEPVEMQTSNKLTDVSQDPATGTLNFNVRPKLHGEAVHSGLKLVEPFLSVAKQVIEVGNTPGQVQINPQAIELYEQFLSGSRPQLLANGNGATHAGYANGTGAVHAPAKT